MSKSTNIASLENDFCHELHAYLKSQKKLGKSKLINIIKKITEVQPDYKLEDLKKKCLSQNDHFTRDEVFLILEVFQDCYSEVVVKRILSQKPEDRLFREFKNLKERYRTVVENFPHGITEIDLEGRITYANLARRKILLIAFNVVQNCVHLDACATAL